MRHGRCYGTLLKSDTLYKSISYMARVVMSFNNGYFQYIMLDIYAVIAVEINIRYQIIGQKLPVHKGNNMAFSFTVIIDDKIRRRQHGQIKRVTHFLFESIIYFRHIKTKRFAVRNNLFSVFVYIAHDYLIKVIKDKQIRFVTGCYCACIFKSEALRSMEGRHSYTRDGAFAHLHGRADYTVYMAV